jgi:hypothetical protein
MSWINIRNAIKTYASGMTAPTFNYNWVVDERNDLPFKPEALFCIQAVEDDQDDEIIEKLDLRDGSGSSGSGQTLYTNERDFYINLKVYNCQEGKDSKLRNRLENVETALELAKNDFLKRFRTPELDLNQILSGCAIESFTMGDLRIKKTKTGNILRPWYYIIEGTIRYRQAR